MCMFALSGRRLKPRRLSGRRGFTTKNSTKRHPREEEKNENSGGRGKKRKISGPPPFGALHFSVPNSLGPTLRGPHPSEPPPFGAPTLRGPHPSGTLRGTPLSPDSPKFRPVFLLAPFSLFFLSLCCILVELHVCPHGLT